MSPLMIINPHISVCLLAGILNELRTTNNWALFDSLWPFNVEEKFGLFFAFGCVAGV